MTANFQADKFIDDYNKWRNVKFVTDEADNEDVYELRYDLYELDADWAGVWISFVDSGFKKYDADIDDQKLQRLLKDAKQLRDRVDGNDAVIVDSYISYMNLMLSMYSNYKGAL